MVDTKKIHHLGTVGTPFPFLRLCRPGTEVFINLARIFFSRIENPQQNYYINIARYLKPLTLDLDHQEVTMKVFGGK
jgi:hypothetical protein